MSAHAWLNYVGAITGIAGMLTGIAGMILACLAYRRSGQLKALELRLNLRYAENDLRASVESLPDLLARSKKSRTRVAAARGYFGSAPIEQWLTAWETDQLAVKDLQEQLPDSADDYQGLDHSALEAKLGTAHALKSKAARLQDKYRSVLTADDREREHIEADLRMRTQSRGRGAE